MTAVLSQAAFGPHVNNLYKDGDPPANVGHCFILMDISKWMPMEEYYTLAEQFIREIKEVPLTKQADEILYPGERRYQTCQENVKQGISLSKEALRELIEVGNECGVSFPLN